MLVIPHLYHLGHNLKVYHIALHVRSMITEQILRSQSAHLHKLISHCYNRSAEKTNSIGTDRTVNMEALPLHFDTIYQSVCRVSPYAASSHQGGMTNDARWTHPARV